MRHFRVLIPHDFVYFFLVDLALYLSSWYLLVIEAQIRENEIKKGEDGNQLVSSPGDSKIGRYGLFNVCDTNEKNEKAEVTLYTGGRSKRTRISVCVLMIFDWKEGLLKFK